MNKREERDKEKKAEESKSCFPFGDFKGLEEMMAGCCKEMRVPECCSPKGAVDEEHGEAE
jgi:hypothetical protein